MRTMAVELRRYELMEGLRDAMDAAGMSQRALAERAGKTQGHVSNVLNGHGNPRLSTMLELLRPLGKTLAIVDLEETWY